MAKAPFYGRLGLVLLLVLSGSADSQAQTAADVQAWAAEFRGRAIAAGLRPATVDANLRGLRPLPRVIELANFQPEFTRPVWQYLANAVSDSRISRGRALMARHRALLQRIEERFAVDRAVVVAIWGIESDFGRTFGSFDVLQSLATLATEGERRTFAETEFLAALRLLDQGDMTRDELRGSWAGAMGHTQFIPSTFLQFGVDFNGNGRRDIFEIEDALASTANYLSKSGFRNDRFTLLEVRLEREFDWALLDETTQPLSDWRGVRRVSGDSLPVSSLPTRLILPAGHRGPAFLISPNFQAILRYNNSTAYALAVAHLADRLAGRDRITADWPTNLTPLNRQQVIELQRRLNSLGFDLGKPDGLVGPKSRAAIKGFQQREGQIPDGFPTISLLERLRTRGGVDF